MPVEIERKFLIANTDWKENISEEVPIKQGYLSVTPERTIRVRTKGDKGYLTIKGKTINTTRAEYEYEIPLSEALELLGLCNKPLIEKTRYHVVTNGNLWEVDVFEGDNEGLIVAEIELENEAQEIILPNWIGEEVSHQNRYFNSQLSHTPFKNW